MMPDGALVWLDPRRGWRGHSGLEGPLEGVLSFCEQIVPVQKAWKDSGAAPSDGSFYWVSKAGERRKVGGPWRGLARGLGKRQYRSRVPGMRVGKG